MKTLLSILFLFFATYGYSQSEKLFTVDRELSNSNINQIYQAKDGVIWIATLIVTTAPSSVCTNTKKETTVHW